MPAINAEQMAALEQAALWYTRLNAETATQADQLAWHAWLDAAPQHGWAWQQAERLQQRLQRVPGTLAERTLDLATRERHANRRSVLKGFVVLVGGGTLAWGGYRQVQDSPWLADCRSRLGERRAVTLQDGSHLLLNSDSAVDVRFDAQQRLVLLRQGEILITTGTDPLRRPFSVQTRQGQTRALGTRFSVREQGPDTLVSVFEDQVQITTTHGATALLSAGQCCRFDAYGIQAPTPLDSTSDAWSRGLLIANDQRLDSFVAELARYRRGWLRCDPGVAALRISGTFELDDSEQILRALAGSLPIRVVQRTRYWVTLLPA